MIDNRGHELLSPNAIHSVHWRKFRIDMDHIEVVPSISDHLGAKESNKRAIS